MTLTEEVLHVIALVTAIGIVITFLVATIFGILFIIKVKKHKDSWIKIYVTIACLMVSAVFTVLLGIKLEEAYMQDVFSIIAIRPAIFFLGGALATSSVYRYIALVYGGDLWTLRKSKTL